MNQLDRYFGLALLRGFVLVLLVLLPLFTFFDLVQQLDDVGKGTYGIWDALRYEIQLLPRRALDLLPFTALMGSTIALALLAHHQELIAMQAAGVSVARIAGSVLKSGLILILAAAAAEEFVASPLHQQAVQARASAIAGGLVKPRKEGFWIHYGNRFVNINKLLYGTIPADIDIFEFGPDRQLELYIQAERADLSSPEAWRLQDLVVRYNEDGVLVAEHQSEMLWESYLQPEQVGLLELPPNAMSPSQSYRYLGYLRDSGQPADRYEMALWQKLTLPLTTGVMVLLAIPFAFGSPRLVSVGKRILMALGAGLGFQIINQLTANLGLVFKLDPVITSLVPILFALGFAGWLLTREQRHTA